MNKEGVMNKYVGIGAACCFACGISVGLVSGAAYDASQRGKRVVNVEKHTSQDDVTLKLIDMGMLRWMRACAMAAGADKLSRDQMESMCSVVLGQRGEEDARR